MTRTFQKQLLTLAFTAALCITMLFGMPTATVSPVSAAPAGTVLGDLNGDGDMTTSDVRQYLQLLITTPTFTVEQTMIGDLNIDGNYNTTDARCILQLLLKGPQTEATRAVWIPYMEMEELLVSGDPATCRNAIAACLDDCVARGANTVYFHVRANSDAYYDSAVYSPNYKTSVLLGKGFDPLECAIELAHAKGLELHAWVNPYRIGSDISRAKADATFEYSGRYYYVPSDAQVQALVINGVRELVDGYDIDGVQFDDYFYPTGSVDAAAAASFETTDYTAYTQAGGTLGISDWRRAHVNKLIAACYAVCHTKTNCIFGISPGYDFASNYNTMYADAATWAKTPGYVDYLCPQLYVGFEHQYAPYDSILGTWDALPRHASVSMIAGLALYKTGLADDTWAGSGRTEWAQNDDILARQIALTKESDWSGIALYSHQSFECGSDRDETVVNAEISSACEAWLVFA